MTPRAELNRSHLEKKKIKVLSALIINIKVVNNKQQLSEKDYLQ